LFWFRVLDIGVFDGKLDPSSLPTGINPQSTKSTGLRAGIVNGGLGEGEVSHADPPPNPKLGLAPLSSEWAISRLGSSSTSALGELPEQ
jgi:hypothetical protein